MFNRPKTVSTSLWTGSSSSSTLSTTNTSITEILHVNVEQGRKDRLLQLSKLEEHRLIALQHQEIQKQQQKALHDRNIKNKNLSVGDISLVYNSRVKGKPKKIHTEWMGSYVFEEIHTNGSIRLRTLQGIVFQKIVNGS